MLYPVFVGLLIGHQQAPKVSLEIRGARLENAAPAIAKALGLDSLEIGATLKNDVVLVRTKDVDAETLKTNLAKVMNATWEKRGDQWWFTQTTEQKIGEQRLFDKERYKYFDELIEKAKKRIGGMKPLDEAECKRILAEIKNLSTMQVNRNNSNMWSRYMKIDDHGPLNKLGYKAAMRLRPETWMKLSEQNPRIVFSTRPTSMQQPFPFKVGDLLADAMSDQNVWSTYATGEPLRGPSAGGADGEQGWYYMGNMNEHRQPFKSSDFYTFTMTLELQNQSIEFIAYDQKGHQTLDTNVNFYDMGDEEVNFDYKAEYEKLKKKMLKFTGDAGEYLDLVAPMNPYGFMKMNRKPISRSLLEKMLHPETIDPLSIAAADVIFESIETPNIIMNMNDMQRQSRIIDLKNPRFNQLNGKVLLDKDGWFLVNQPNPVAARKLMPDRKRLGKLMRYINDNNRPLNLEEQAGLAFELPWENDSSYMYQSHFAPLKSTEVDTYNNRAGLRMYGALNSGERTRAKKGGLPVGTMSQDAKLELFRAIFYTQRYEGQIEMDYSAMESMTPAQQREFNDMQNMIYGGIYGEKTFVFPNGLTNDLSITIEDETTNQLYCGRPEPQGEEEYYGGGRTLSASSLGDYMFKMTNPKKYRWEVQSYNKIDENDIHLASQRNLTIKLKINKMLFLSWRLNQTLLTDPKTYTTKTLPQSVLDEIKKGYEDAEKNDKNYGYYGGGPTKVTQPPR